MDGQADDLKLRIEECPQPGLKDGS
jgi:hypothetical protein